MKTYTRPQKPFASSEIDKRATPRPRLGLRYGASMEAHGDGSAKA